MKKRIRKVILSGFLAINFIFGTVACGNVAASSNAAERVDEVEENIEANGEVGEFTIRIGVNSLDNNFLLKILDNHTGFLKEKGINLETTEFAAGINTIDAITTDTVDIGLFATYAGVNRIGNTVGNTELRAFSMIDKTQNYYLAVNPETIKKPEDLVGRVGVSQAGVVFEYFFAELFHYYDINPDDVTITNVGSVQEALALAANGQGDAYWTAKSNLPKFEEQGWVPLLSIGDIGLSMYSFTVANDSYLKEHKAEVAKYLQVSEEGFKYIDENLEEFSDWILADTGLDKEIFKASWNERRHRYDFEQEAYDDLLKVKNWCYENGRFSQDYKVADYINTDALAEAFPDRVNWTATE